MSLSVTILPFSKASVITSSSSRVNSAFIRQRFSNEPLANLPGRWGGDICCDALFQMGGKKKKNRDREKKKKLFVSSLNKCPTISRLVS